MAAPSDPSESFLPALIAGDISLLLSGFAGEPSVDDPLGGRVRGAHAFGQYVRERQAWLNERKARLEPIRTTKTDARSVSESLICLALPNGEVELPVAVAGSRTPAGRLDAVRVYHSLWPLLGAHRIRAALLPHDPALELAGSVADYQRALAAGDVDAILQTFEPDGYFREPAGGEHVYRGQARLRYFMSMILAAGGIALEHCTVTDDGVACAIEFNAVAFGRQPLVPQAGIAVYERGPSGKLHGARIYDDVNVEALAGQSGGGRGS